MQFDGHFLRLATYHDLTIWTLSRAGEVIARENAPTRAPAGLAWDGEALWIAEDYEDKVFRK